MAKAKSELAWTTIDPTTLSAQDQANYKAYKDSYTTMKAARAKFEQGMNDADKPNGMRIVCAFNFGKLSVALAPDEPKAHTASRATHTLSEWIASQRASGRNS